MVATILFQFVRNTIRLHRNLPPARFPLRLLTAEAFGLSMWTTHIRKPRNMSEARQQARLKCWDVETYRQKEEEYIASDETTWSGLTPTGIYASYVARRILEQQCELLRKEREQDQQPADEGSHSFDVACMEEKEKGENEAPDCVVDADTDADDDKNQNSRREDNGE